MIRFIRHGVKCHSCDAELLSVSTGSDHMVVCPVCHGWGDYTDVMDDCSGLVRTGRLSLSLQAYIARALSDMSSLRTRRVAYE
jgi:hypothetical protein